MSAPIDAAISANQLIPILAIICGSIIAIVAIIFSCVKGMVVSRNREQTKRELAAYVAEGTLDADKAVEMMKAGRPYWEEGQKPSGKGGCC